MILSAAKRNVEPPHDPDKPKLASACVRVRATVRACMRVCAGVPVCTEQFHIVQVRVQKASVVISVALQSAGAT